MLPRVNKSVFATMCLCYLFSTTIRCFILCSRLKHLKRLIKKKSNCTHSISQSAHPLSYSQGRRGRGEEDFAHKKGDHPSWMISVGSGDDLPYRAVSSQVLSAC